MVSYKMFKGHYEEWRISRMNGLLKYIPSQFFKSKTLLELGCGHADIGNMFYDLGAIVTSSDVRKEHLEIVNTKYPHIHTFLMDCDDLKITDSYDIILHWGLLYHLHEIDKHIEYISQKCKVLLLETEVCDSDNKSVYLSTDENGYDQAFNNKGIRPSESYVETILSKNGFEYRMIKDPILNSSFHRYDWDISNTNTWTHGLRRFWICWKNIDTPCEI